MIPTDAATSTTATAPAKAHYTVLDGLRGVASLTVVIFHLFEAWDGGNPRLQIINHGYLAVDFFFLLSGFVIAYAYDDRWAAAAHRRGMGVGEFFKRRLVRLQPMVVMGTLIGAQLFYPASLFHGMHPLFPLVATTPVWKLALVALIGCTLLPLPIGMDIRGWQEMHPLDGPGWSLFYEYVGNILYALGVRRLSRSLLTLLVIAAGAFLFWTSVFSVRGDIIGGWALNSEQIHIGLARLLYPFFAGILLERLGRRLRVPNAFAAASVLLLVVLALPRMGSAVQGVWSGTRLNGLYDALAILLVFPLIVAIGASDQREDGPSVRVARQFGELSYPLYITHYPLVYIYTAWVVERQPSHLAGAVVGAATLLLALAIAWLCLRFYDEPVRRWLSRRFLQKQAR